MTEKLAARPGMKLAKIGGLIIGVTVALVIALAIFDSGFGGPLLFVIFLMGFIAGGILVIVGFIKRLFAALENR